MANCIDCVHFEVCQYDEQERAEANLEPSYRDLSKYIADGCKFFKNKADFVEVIRCGECEHFKEHSVIDASVPSGWGKCTKINMDIDLTINDYCSYGERQGNK